MWSSLALFAQPDTLNSSIDTLPIPESITPPPPESIVLANYEVKYEKEGLIFSSATKDGVAKVKINGEETDLNFVGGKAKFPMELGNGKLTLIKNQSNYNLVHFSKAKDGSIREKKIPLWLSILPPLLAIFLALIFREVIASLFTGILAGAFVANGLRFDIGSIFGTLWSTIDYYIIQALNDGGHLSIIVFSLLIGGMVAVISRNGGMAGVVDKLAFFATNAKRSQFVTWLLGIAIFFDDYANTLIVGNTMRSTTDRFKVSREKLAYIVDSTAAPISALAFVTTWIGFELGQIESGLAVIEGMENVNPYSVFLSSIKYSFYPIFTLIFILLIIFFRKDYGPMYRAETRARTTGEVAPKQGEITEEGDMEDLSPVKGASRNWLNAFIPVMTVILVTIYGLFFTGFSACYDEIMEIKDIGAFSWGTVWANISELGDQGKLGIIIGNADSYVALLWASFSGLLVAIMLTIGGRIMKLNDTMNTMIAGFKAMLPAVIILVLAWSLAHTTEQLYTADYLTSLFLGKLSPYSLPIIIFILAAVISFSTGSSWSTMAILYPIAIPLTWSICQDAGLPLEDQMELLYNVISIVLAASVLGDHCSPISDTTILSSLATDCNHIDHVRTQLPYAMTVGVISLAFAYISTRFGTPFILNLVVGVLLMALIVYFLGKDVPESELKDHLAEE